MTTPAIPLPVLIDAVVALRAVKDAPGDTVPAHLWKLCMRACNQLEYSLHEMTVPVDLAAAMKANKEGA